MTGSIVLDLEKSCVAAPGFVMIEALEQILEFSVADLSTKSSETTEATKYFRPF